MVRFQLHFFKWFNFLFGFFNMLCAAVGLKLNHPDTRVFVISSLIHAVGFCIFDYALERTKPQPPKK